MAVGRKGTIKLEEYIRVITEYNQLDSNYTRMTPGFISCFPGLDNLLFKRVEPTIICEKKQKPEASKLPEKAKSA